VTAKRKKRNWDADSFGDERWTRKDVVLSGAMLVLFLLLWEIGIRVLKVPELIVPAPSAVFEALRLSLVSGFLLPHIGVTLFEVVAGYLIGAIAALTLGCAVAQFRIVDRVIYPYIVCFQAVPKVALAPLLVIWFGFGLSSKVLMTAIISFFPILVNTVVGVKTVERERIELMIALNATRWQTFMQVRLPSALPFIFAGLEIGAVMAVIGAVVGEFVGADGGLGYMLLVYQADLKNAFVFAILIILAAMGMILHALIVAAHRHFVFWTRTGGDRPTGV